MSKTSSVSPVKNTLTGAMLLNEIKNSSNENRYNHILRVVHNCEDLLKTLDLSHEEEETVLMAAYLHDIGYSKELKSTGFHPYDGYKYLKNNGWSEDVCLLVLYHSEASTAPRIEHHELQDLYKEPLPKHLMTMYKILTIADMTADGVGELVTVEERVQDIKNRYGENNPLVEHSIDLSYKAVTWLIELKLDQI